MLLLTLMLSGLNALASLSLLLSLALNLRVQYHNLLIPPLVFMLGTAPIIFVLFVVITKTH